MSVPANGSSRLLLRLVLSVRKITVQVTDTSTTTIVAMASSDESQPPRPAGVALKRFPRHCWGSATAASVGERLASRLKEIGVDCVDIDAEEETSRPPRQRMMVLPLFESVRRAGIELGGGVDRLGEVRKEFLEKQICKNTVQGRYLMSDDNGHVCDAFSLDPQTRCCPENGAKFSCQGCSLLSKCCNSYEYCVSCCLSPTRTKKDCIQKVKIAKPAAAGTYSSVFEFCAGRCRHNSESVIHENAYVSMFHHCFSQPSNNSGMNDKPVEAGLNGINVIVGRKGEAFYSVCKSIGQSCVPSKLSILNQCEIMQKYMSCRGSCLAIVGSDQPAEVVDDAPKDLNPGACLYTQQLSILSCDGSHQHTRRLCPCA